MNLKILLIVIAVVILVIIGIVLITQTSILQQKPQYPLMKNQSLNNSPAAQTPTPEINKSLLQTQMPETNKLLYNCGNDKCELTLDENCSNCEGDCGSCKYFEDKYILGILLENSEIGSVLESLKECAMNDLLVRTHGGGIPTTYRPLRITKDDLSSINNIDLKYGMQINKRWGLIEVIIEYAAWNKVSPSDPLDYTVFYRISFVFDPSSLRVLTPILSSSSAYRCDSIISDFNNALDFTKPLKPVKVAYCGNEVCDPGEHPNNCSDCVP